MYAEKMVSILDDLENKETEVAGGAVVGMNLAIVNSLIKYIANLTIGKKKYIDVQGKVQEILENSDELKEKSLEIIDGDKEILKDVLMAYKNKKEDEEKYIQVCKKAVEFCIEVLNIAYETLKLADDISKVGNRMLASDFEICKYYAYASVKSAIINVKINLESIEEAKYKKLIEDKYKEILKKCKSIVEETN